LLELGATVVLENGFWSRAERDALRLRARELGARVELHTLDLPLDELWPRIAHRNTQPAWPARPITRDELETWAVHFEAPTPEELALFDRP
jgi:predicted kinase